jgi:hypothetical protein
MLTDGTGEHLFQTIASIRAIDFISRRSASVSDEERPVEIYDTIEIAFRCINKTSQYFIECINGVPEGRLVLTDTAAPMTTIKVGCDIGDLICMSYVAQTPIYVDSMLAQRTEKDMLAEYIKLVEADINKAVRNEQYELAKNRYVELVQLKEQLKEQIENQTAESI